MADLLQQATIADDPTFRLRVRQAIIARALQERHKPLAETSEPARALALDVLEQTDEWATQIARGLATITADFDHVTEASQIDDAAIVSFLDTIFAAYIKG